MRNSRQGGADRGRRPCAGRAAELRVSGLVVAALLGACARFGYQLLPDDEGGSLGAGGAGFSPVGTPIGGVGNTSGDSGTGDGGAGDGGAGNGGAGNGGAGGAGDGGASDGGDASTDLDSGVAPPATGGASADSGPDATVVPPPTCSDGLQNGDETGSDCGGSSCLPCPCALGAPQLMGNPNSPGNFVWSPTLSADGRTLYIGVYVGGGNELIGVTTRPDRGDTFGFANVLPAPVTASTEGTPFLSFDGLSLYFYSTRAGGVGDRDLYRASRPTTSDEFNSVAAVAGVNSASMDHLPWLSDDELTIYFTTLRAGTEDIYRAGRATRGAAFNPPLPVPELNTAGLDSGPTLSRDRRVVIFSSDRSGGRGGLDLYQASRATTGVDFTDPVNLGSINSTANELDPELSPDGTELFFISDRNGGETQLFRATRSCP